MTITIFKTAVDYTIAHQYKGNNCVCLDEWTGRTVEEFAAAMGRPADSTNTMNLSRGPVTEYVWHN